MHRIFDTHSMPLFFIAAIYLFIGISGIYFPWETLKSYSWLELFFHMIPVSLFLVIGVVCIIGLVSEMYHHSPSDLDLDNDY